MRTMYKHDIFVCCFATCDNIAFGIHSVKKIDLTPKKSIILNFFNRLYPLSDALHPKYYLIIEMLRACCLP